MAGNDAKDRLFEALNESYDAFIDALRAANDRYHRVGTALIEGAQQNQRDAIEVAKKWADAPLDLIGLYGSIVEATTKAQGRALEATREWFGEMSQAQREARDVVQRVVTVNRNAGAAAADVARGMFSRANEAVQTAGQAARTNGAERTPQESTPASEPPAGSPGF
jgi:hypothetical protein